VLASVETWWPKKAFFYKPSSCSTNWRRLCARQSWRLSLRQAGAWRSRTWWPPIARGPKVDQRQIAPRLGQKDVKEDDRLCKEYLCLYVADSCD